MPERGLEDPKTPADRARPLLCAALAAASILATIPVLEMGLYDDWSYTYTARALAVSGRMAYTNWGAPMVGVQACWAAALIRLFGFSFTLVRLSTLPFAAGCAFLLYWLGRAAGLNPRFAVFASLSVALSPLFIPMAASFMTDIPAMFFWLACLCWSMRAAEAPGELRAAGWMAAAAAAGVAGGSIRQVVWVVPLLVLPAVAWFRRREPPVVAAAAGLWMATAATEALCFRWFLAQPHTHLGASSWPGVPLARTLVVCGVQFFSCGVECLLLVLPVLAIYLSDWRGRFRAPLSLALSLLVSGAGLAIFTWRLGKDLLIGNIVSPDGILGAGTEAMGYKPRILPASALGALELALAVCVAVTAAALVARSKSRRGTADPDALSLRRFLWLSVPPALAYMLAVLYLGNLYDRYLLPLLPVIAIPLLWAYQRAVRNAPPALGWAIVCVLALYGIATTHDYIAAGRARAQAAAALTSAGIPRTSITAGFEYDGWTQLEQSGVTASFHAGMPLSHAYPVSPPYRFWAATPSVDPVYFVMYSRLAALHDSRFPPVRYRAWLPPFVRQVVTQVAPR
jgi:hypothetical protein